MDIMNPASLRARFAELGETRDAMLAASSPLREQRDEILAECEPRIKALSTQIAEAEDGLFDIDQERALIARALGGRTGEE